VRAEQASHAHDAHGPAAAADHGHDAHGPGGPVRESPWTMTVPLGILAVLSIVGGFVGMPFQPGGHVLERWLRPVMEGAVPGVPVHEMSPAGEWALIGISVLVAVVGIVAAFRVYLQQPGLATGLQNRFGGLHRLLLNKYWVDEFYDATVVGPVYRWAVHLWRFWDETIVDGAVNGVGSVAEGLSGILRLFQTGYVGTYALFVALGVLALFLHFLLRS